mgnify:CR=1 FL=1
MKKFLNIVTPLIILLAILTACESNDMPIQHADNYAYISFSAKTEKTLTRTNPYEKYDAAKHPATMGVFGYYSSTSHPNLDGANSIYSNESVSYNSTTENWTATNRKRWNEYLGKATSFHFFAYMPKVDGAKVIEEKSDATSSTSTSRTFTLSFPFAMSTSAEETSSENTSSNPTPSPVIFDIRKAPIICAKPQRKDSMDAQKTEYLFDRVVNFKFDQTLTGYRLLFKLDTKMGAVRQFRIKRVTLSGNLATSGTVSRSYTWDMTKKEWTQGAIEWKEGDLTYTNYTATAPFEIPYKENTDNTLTAFENETKSILLDNSITDYTQWGPAFYTIPDKNFTPTIKVTYDVVFKDEKQQEVITRKDVTSAIELNEKNFESLKNQKQGVTAMIYPICILIQPRYLYVLADEDAYTGHLLID